MPSTQSTLAVRMLGFSPREESAFSVVLSVARENGFAYQGIKQGNLREPDLFLVNAASVSALAEISAINPTKAQPVLLIGHTAINLPYESLPRPLRWRQVFEKLDDVAFKREEFVNSLSAFETVAVMDRRRSPRLDMDLRNPEEYLKMRRAKTEPRSILIVDRNSSFKKYIAAIIARYEIPVKVTSSEEQALALDLTHRFSMVLINTSMEDIDPYGLCLALKDQAASDPNATGRMKDVIFLAGKSFQYHPVKAEAAGCDGFLEKPVSRKLLLATLQKFLNLI
jgi:CheY-like chemotaxis protein